MWEQVALNMALGVLSSMKRNPLKNPALVTVLQHIVIDACEILGVAPPTFS